MPDDPDETERLASLTDAEQVALLEQTDNRGPRDRILLPQMPGSTVDA